MLRMLDLFSGIGGFSYAGEKLVGGYKTVAFCEYDKHCQRVLRKHWPDTEIIDDVRDLADDADRFRGLVDIVVGGYPCQPFSLAGVRRGDKDDRHLWPEMFKIIEAVRPTWVIGENVAGHITMGLDTVLSDLEAAGYGARCFVIPAVAADARHRRDRCWVVANTSRKHWGGKIAGFDNQSVDSPEACQRSKARDRFADGGETMADAESNRRHKRQSDSRRRAERDATREKQRFGDDDSVVAECRWWKPEPELGRVAYGIPNRVHRLRQLGNSIVPQVAARILWAIREAHNG